MDFDLAVQIVLDHEGRLADDKDDPGGITNYGISLRYAKSLGVTLMDIDHDGDVDADDIRKMTVEDAKRIYKIDWWDRYGYGKLPDYLSWKVFDLSVNMGPKNAHRCLQASVGAEIDGIIGPKTLKSAALTVPRKAGIVIRAAAWEHYQNIINNNPKLKKYSLGWERRAFA